MKSYLLIIKALVYVLWPATTWAASITFGSTLSEVPGLAWLMVFIVSTVSGLAALLGRLKNVDPPRPVIFAVAHMLGSWVAGAAAFFAAEHADAADMNEALAIVIASYAGARLLDAASDRFTENVRAGAKGAPDA